MTTTVTGLLCWRDFHPSWRGATAQARCARSCIKGQRSARNEAQVDQLASSVGTTSGPAGVTGSVVLSQRQSETSVPGAGRAAAQLSLPVIPLRAHVLKGCVTLAVHVVEHGLQLAHRPAVTLSDAEGKREAPSLSANVVCPHSSQTKRSEPAMCVSAISWAQSRKSRIACPPQN
jgi:hypothetical protein